MDSLSLDLVAGASVFIIVTACLWEAVTRPSRFSVLRLLAAVVFVCAAGRGMLLESSDNISDLRMSTFLAGMAGGKIYSYVIGKVKGWDYSGRLLFTFAIVAAAGLVASCVQLSHNLYFYGHALRESGMFDDPNLLGCLLSCALLALLVIGIDAWLQRPPRWAQLLTITLIAASLCSFKLVLTYSRSAVIGLALASLYVATDENVQRLSQPLARAGNHFRNRWFVAGTAAALALLSYMLWDTSARVVLARRILSLTDLYDLSLLHRVFALESGTRLVIDAPFFGYGRDCAGEMNDIWYVSKNIVTGAAIDTNDYFVFGAWIGLGGLVALLLYAAPLLVLSDERAKPPATQHPTLQRLDTGVTVVGRRQWLRRAGWAMAGIIAFSALANDILFSPGVGFLCWGLLEMANRSTLENPDPAGQPHL